MAFLRLICFIGLTIACCSALHVAVRNSEKSPYCIILDSNITGTVDYHDNVKNTTVAYEFAVNDTSVNVVGKCHEVIRNDSVEFVEIFFVPKDIVTFTPLVGRWSIKLTFEAPSSASPPTKSFVIANYRLIANFYPEAFNTTAGEVTYDKAGDANLEWSASDKHGFQCSSSSLTLTNNSNLVFSQLQVLAFAIVDNGTFPANQEFELCQLDTRTSDLVPIIVGACLAGLVIVVLIAYIIGRARAKRQGYASV